MAEATNEAPEFELDQEAKDLKLEQAKAESRKAIVEAQGATLKALQPGGGTEAVGDDVTFDEKAGSLVSVVAARQVERVAAAIAGRVALAVGSGAVMLIEGLQTAQDDAVFAEVTARLAAFDTDLTAAETGLIAPPPPPPDKGATPKVLTLALLGGGISAAIGLAQLGSGLLSMLRTDVAVSGREVKIDRMALFAEVAEELRERGIPTALAGFGLVGKTETLTKFSGLLKRRTELNSAVVAKAQTIASKQRRIDGYLVRIAAQNAALDKANSENDTAKAALIAQVVSALESELATLESDASYIEARIAIDRAREVITRFDAFATAVSAIGEGQKNSLLVSAALREAIRGGIEINNVKKEITHVLYLTLTSSGGDVVSKKGRIRDAETAFLGAVQATYVLGDLGGRIASSGAVTRFGSAEFKWDSYKLLPGEPDPS